MTVSPDPWQRVVCWSRAISCSFLPGVMGVLTVPEDAGWGTRPGLLYSGAVWPGSHSSVEHGLMSKVPECASRYQILPPLFYKIILPLLNKTRILPHISSVL